ncbi:hypothetical protein Hanom_Chr12g01150191 [Helianthus anomalus]
MISYLTANFQDKLLVDVTRSLSAADNSPPTPPPALLGFKVRSGLVGRLRSTESDRFATGVVEFLEIRGEGALLEGVTVRNEFEFEFEFEVEVEGDRYLEETCLDLGLTGVMTSSSFSVGNNEGRIVWFLVVVSETAATIIKQDTYK